MDVVFEGPRGEVELRLVPAPEARVADVVAALGGRPDAVLHADGRPLDPAEPVAGAGVASGARLRLVPSGMPDRPPTAPPARGGPAPAAPTPPTRVASAPAPAAGGRHPLRRVGRPAAAGRPGLRLAPEPQAAPAPPGSLEQRLRLVEPPPDRTPDPPPGRAPGPLPGRTPELRLVTDKPSLRPAPDPAATVELRVVGGLDAGGRIPLAPGVHVLGRAPETLVLDSPTVSPRHARLTVTATGCTVADLGSLNGTRVDGAWVTSETPLPPGAVLQLGAVQLGAATPPPDDAPALPGPNATGAVTFDRPPRPPAPERPAPIAVPAKPAPTGGNPRFHWAAVLAPLVLGLAMVAITGNLTYALFTLLSPLMAVATWYEERRRARRDRRTGARTFAEQLADFERRLDDAHATETAARREAAPDLAELARRALAPSVRLWERRPGHPDFLTLSAGLGDLPWHPDTTESYAERAPEADSAIAHRTTLPAVPVEIPLSPGSVVGVVGDAGARRALARALACQAAVAAGPADLRIAVLTDAGRAWDWAKWLPHTAGTDAAGTRLLAATPAERDALIAHLAAAPDGPLHLVVVDADGLTQGRNAPARELLAAGGVAGIVLADRLDRLPAACTTVVTLDGPDGAARLGHIGFLAAGVTEPNAREIARALARYEDADLVAAGGDLPDEVHLSRLLDPARLRERWAAPPPGLSVPLGVTERGPLTVDLVADGPHGLVAGTTGSGKSELLRTLVAGLAASYSPLDLTFVLIDYKGGSAFAECAALPHTVGMVTDLDEQLGRRALVCLEAELRHRERVLRDAGCSDLPEYVRAGTPRGPLPRLLVVIDEFATMAAELPDFVDSLVGVAQRGRSLGVHLLLATQRPSGSVKESIRANTNLRVALRVQDVADSTDVIGSPAAASLSRRTPGRAFLRLGPGEIVAFQSALVTGSARDAARPAVAVTPFVFGPGDAPAEHRAEAGETDLVRLVAAAREAAAGLPAPRTPWPAPLPATVTLDDLADPDAIGLADDPGNQRQVAYPRPRGNLLLYGVAGSGTSTALVTIARAIARGRTPGEVHVYAMDFGNQALAPLAALPHVGAVLQPGERERQERLVRYLRDEVHRRQRARATGDATRCPDVVLLLDNWSAFESVFDDVPGLAIRDDLTRVVADGPGLGVYVVATADRAMGVPAAVSTLVPGKLVFRLSDRHDYGSFGIRPPAGDPPPGRAVDVATGLEVQLALPGNPPVRTGGEPPRPVEVLGEYVPLAAIAGAARLDGDEWRLPVGLGGALLEPACLTLRPGDGVLVTGPARSGKTTLLRAVAELVAAHRPDVVVRWGEPAAALDDPRPQLVLLDDVDLTDDATALALARARRPDVKIVAAGRADGLRAKYEHVSVELRRSRQGVALRPRLDTDGDLWGVLLPRHGPVRFAPGRGYLVSDGEVELVQGAQP